MAELVSAWPTAEGQIYWAEKLAPPRCAAFVVRPFPLPNTTSHIEIFFRIALLRWVVDGSRMDLYWLISCVCLCQRGLSSPSFLSSPMLADSSCTRTP
jgi:hypothetical protein